MLVSKRVLQASRSHVQLPIQACHQPLQPLPVPLNLKPRLPIPNWLSTTAHERFRKDARQKALALEGAGSCIVHYAQSGGQSTHCRHDLAGLYLCKHSQDYRCLVYNARHTSDINNLLSHMAYVSMQQRLRAVAAHLHACLET